jgi:uroporphyrinogen-III synthase
MPKFKQNGTAIGAFGSNTSKAVEEAGLKLSIKAPEPQAPSMVTALEKYLSGLQPK